MMLSNTGQVRVKKQRMLLNSSMFIFLAFLISRVDRTAVRSCPTLARKRCIARRRARVLRESDTVHKNIHSLSADADHLRDRLLAYLRQGLTTLIVSPVCKGRDEPSQVLLSRAHESAGEVLLQSGILFQEKRDEINCPVTSLAQHAEDCCAVNLHQV